MDVWTDWCGWCTKLRTGTFPSPQAKAVLANLVPLSVRTQDLQGKPTADAWVQDKYKVQAYPMLIILRADGTVKASQAGYMGPVDFADWVRKNSGK
jgi:thioredoxin-related protein